jgi:hypothetical protein
VKTKVFCAFAMILITLAGCERKAEMPGPTVSKFTGKVMAGSNPVTFKEGSTVIVDLVHSSGQRFGIPIKADGSFQIGEMPIGKYSATVKIEGSSGEKGKSSAPKMINIASGFEIVDGKTEYTIDLGKDFKP